MLESPRKPTRGWPTFGLRHDHPPIGGLRRKVRRRFVEGSMASLRQLLAESSVALVIDAASSRIQVGWVEASGAENWASSDEEAGVGIFRALAALGRNPAEAKAFVYCDGPGSILGIRSVAMALRSWCVFERRPVLAYCSLALVAHARGRREVTAVADARRNTWHAYAIGESLRRCEANALHGDLIMPEGFRHWSPLPAGTNLVPYSVPDLWRQLRDADLLTATDAPDAFLHEEPSYVAWTPQIHRAPSTR